MDWIKGTVVIIIILLYWRFIYYKYHEKNFTPLSFVLYGGFAGIIGFYSLFILKTVKFSDYNWLFYILAGFAAISFSLVLIGWKKHSLISGVDITLHWIDKVLGRPFVYIAMLVTFPVFFFALAGSYTLLGKEHIFLWGMVILAWIKSNIRLFRHYILR